MTTKTNQIKPIRMSDIEEDARKAGVPASVRESEQPQHSDQNLPFEPPVFAGGLYFARRKSDLAQARCIATELARISREQDFVLWDFRPLVDLPGGSV
jgi:hypothetical protein